jgi:itaconate CoA-transferase
MLEMMLFSDIYRRKLSTPAKAVERIKDNDSLVPGLSVAEPPALLNALADRLRAGDLKKLRAFSSLSLEYSAKTILAPDLSDCVDNYSWFVSSSDRNAVKVGLSYYVPNYARELPRLIAEYMDLDVCMTTVSPMDKAGYFSFGTSNDYTSTAARHCKRLIVEVNRNMPRVFGDSMIHISEVYAIVENHIPLLELPEPPPKPEDAIIGKLIADLVPDGATIALGVGGIPGAVARSLADHKDLGIHSGAFVPAMVDLIEKGVINGRKKTIHPRKHVFTIAPGTKRQYDFLNDNPSMESYPVSYVEDPNIIARHDNMISISSILEVDLLGQCNAEYLGGAQFGGTGGQLDFVRGAFAARNGKAFLAFYSTARGGKASRVVPRFESGTAMTTPRMDVHYLVTEYGVVNLKGKSTHDRALDITSLAHPSFRDGLIRAAEDMHLV